MKAVFIFQSLLCCKLIFGPPAFMYFCLSTVLQWARVYIFVCSRMAGFKARVARERAAVLSKPEADWIKRESSINENKAENERKKTLFSVFFFMVFTFWNTSKQASTSTQPFGKVLHSAFCVNAAEAASLILSAVASLLCEVCGCPALSLTDAQTCSSTSMTQMKNRKERWRQQSNLLVMFLLSPNFTPLKC